MFFIKDNIVLREPRWQRQAQGLPLLEIQLTTIIKNISSVVETLCEIVELPCSNTGIAVVINSRCEILHLRQPSENKSALLVSSETLTEGEVNSKLLIGESGCYIGNRLSVFPFHPQYINSLFATIEIGVNKIAIGFLKVYSDIVTVD